MIGTSTTRLFARHVCRTTTLFKAAAPAATRNARFVAKPTTQQAGSGTAFLHPLQVTASFSSSSSSSSSSSESVNDKEEPSSSSTSSSSSPSSQDNHTKQTRDTPPTRVDKKDRIEDYGGPHPHGENHNDNTTSTPDHQTDVHVDDNQPQKDSQGQFAKKEDAHKEGRVHVQD